MDGELKFRAIFDYGDAKKSVDDLFDVFEKGQVKINDAFNFGRSVDANKKQLLDMISITKQTLSELESVYRTTMAEIKDAGGLSQVSEEERKYLDNLKEGIAAARAEIRGLQENLKEQNFNKSIFAGLAQGLQGVMGAYTAVTGVMAQFGAKSEDLARIQTRLQASMSILMGIQQVYNTLQSTSAFRLQALTKATELYSKAQAALAKSSLLAKLGIAGLVAGVAIAAVKIISSMSKISKANKEAREEYQALSSQTAQSAASQIVTFHKLQKEWKNANGNIDEQRRLVVKNKDEWKQLGIEVNNINDYERYAVEQAPNVVAAMTQKAQAAAKLALAEELYSKALKDRMDAEELQSKVDAENERQKNMGIGRQILEGFTGISGWKQIASWVRKSKSKNANERAAREEARAESLIAESITDAQAAETVLPDINTKKALSDVAKQYENYSEFLRKKEVERSRMIVDLEMDTQQARINAMKDGTAKTLAQIDFDFRNEQESISRWYDDLIEEKIERDRELWEANPANQGKFFIYNRDDYTQTDQETELRDARILENEKKRLEKIDEVFEKYLTSSDRRKKLQERLQSERAEYVKLFGEQNSGRIDAQNQYELAQFDWEQIADFGSYEQMLDALRKKWQAQIALLPEDLKDGATRKMNAEILDLVMANSEEYRRIFADADSMTKSTLEDTIQYAEALLQGKINAGASIEEIKALRDQIDKLREASESIDFSGWGGTLQGYVMARSRRNAANANRDSLLKQASTMVRNARTLDDPTGSAVYSTKAWKDLQEQIKNATDAGEKWGETMEKEAAALGSTKLGDMLQQIGSAMAEVASISGNDSLSNVAEGFMEIGGAVSNIAQGFASGGLWGGIAAAIGTVTDKIIDAFTSVAVANAKYKKFLEDFRRELELLNLTIKDSDFENAFGTDEYGKFVSAYDKMTEALQKFAGASKDLKGLDIKTKDYSWWANLFGKKDQYQGFDEFDVFDENGLLDVDKARAFLDASTQLTDAQREEIENAIELREAYDELVQITSSFVESLTGKVASSLADEMVQNFIDTGSAIVDADKYLNDFNKNLAKSIIQSTLLQQVFTDDAKDEIAKLLYDGDWQGAASKYKDLVDQANDLAPTFQEFMKEVGVMGDSLGQQNATAGGFQTMSQDTASELNGRFTALQIAGENILLETRGIHADTESMRNATDELRSLSLISMGYLEDIERNTRVIPGMSETLEEIKKYSKQMVS